VTAKSNLLTYLLTFSAVIMGLCHTRWAQMGRNVTFTTNYTIYIYTYMRS